MDEDDIPEIRAFNLHKYIRTYSKFHRNNLKAAITLDKYEKSTDEIPQLPLTTKNAVKYLLEGTLQTKVCRYCLNEASPLTELDQILQVAGKAALYQVTIRDMIASFHPFKVADDPNFPNKICNKCLDHTITSYLFAQQCEQAERALRNCFYDMYEKLERLDPLEQTKKRGRQKLYPNHNILHAEHEKVINYAEPLINLIHIESESLIEEEGAVIKDLECLKCSQILPNVESLLNHEKMHPKSMWYNCRLCGKSFPKRHQMKKHIKTHSKDKPTMPTDTITFTCKRCGEVNNDYNKHLQHLEKHKFKMIMEHLVEGKMDKLCTICLGQDTDMTELDKMVCLHGGCPELSGDKPLYNILASTLPDQKSYKYQELLIASKASIVQFMRKNAIIQNSATNEQISKAIKQFDLSQPILISKDNIDYNDLYIFFFTEPEKIHTVLSERGNPTEFNGTENELMEPEPNPNYIRNQFYDTNQISVIRDDVMMCTVSDKIIYPFSKPKYVTYDKEKMDEIEMDKGCQESSKRLKVAAFKSQLCKMCWIFNKSVCEQCKKTSNETNMNSNIVTDIDGKKNYIPISNYCNHCWIFKHLDKCNICNKLTKNNEKMPITDFVRREISSEQISLTTNIISKEVINTSKTLTWKCSICLINNNMDRETCNCCESQAFPNEMIKINLTNNKTFTKVSNTEQNNMLKSNINIEIHNHKQTGCLMNNSPIESNTLKQSEEVNTLNTNTKNDGLINLPMDVDVGQDLSYSHNRCSEINLIREEQMDVEEDCVTLPDYNLNFKKTQEFNIPAIQFHIGSSIRQENNGKSHVKPRRKVSRASHK